MKMNLQIVCKCGIIKEYNGRKEIVHAVEDIIINEARCCLKCDEEYRIKGEALYIDYSNKKKELEKEYWG